MILYDFFFFSFPLFQFSALFSFLEVLCLLISTYFDLSVVVFNKYLF